MPLSNKKEFITSIANNLIVNRRTMPVSTLAVELNHCGFHTNYDAKFSGGRGTYTTVAKTCKSLNELGRHNEANNVANAFVDKQGKPAWRKD
jgi:hypothetical protein